MEQIIYCTSWQKKCWLEESQLKHFEAAFKRDSQLFRNTLIFCVIILAILGEIDWRWTNWIRISSCSRFGDVECLTFIKFAASFYRQLTDQHFTAIIANNLFIQLKDDIKAKENFEFIGNFTIYTNNRNVF